MDKRRDHRESKGVEDLIFILFRTYIKTVADSLIVTGFAESEMVALMRSFDKKGEVMIGILSSMDETLKGVKKRYE